jgi:hypothetical protein
VARRGPDPRGVPGAAGYRRPRGRHRRGLTQAGQRDEWRAAGQAINEARHTIRDTSHTLHADQDRDLDEGMELGGWCFSGSFHRSARLSGDNHGCSCALVVVVEGAAVTLGQAERQGDLLDPVVRFCE